MNIQILKPCSGFLQDTVGFILKPVQGGIKGLRELRFYEFIKNQSNDLEQSKKILSEYLSKEADISEIKMTESIITPTMCHDINTLQTFVPKYHGIWDTPVHPGGSSTFCSRIHSKQKLFLCNYIDKQLDI